jgi:hypothetical protein
LICWIASVAERVPDEADFGVYLVICFCRFRVFRIIGFKGIFGTGIVVDLLAIVGFIEVIGIFIVDFIDGEVFVIFSSSY